MNVEARSRPSILVVVNEPARADLYISWLQESYRIRTGDSSEAPLDAVDESIDLILIDQRLLPSSSDNSVGPLQHSESDCPIILLTETSANAPFFSYQCDATMEKPVEREKLLEIVENLLDIRSYDDLQTQLSSLRVRRNVLKTEHYSQELADHEHFQELERRIDELEAELAALSATQSTDAMTVARNL